MSGRGLLNANQQRRLGTSLRMLRHDVAAVASWPELVRPGEAREAIRALVARLVPAVESLEATLDLPAERPVPAARRLTAVAEVWANRLEDLHARGLRPYGKVHPDLAGVLDAKLDALIVLLEELADAAARLPPR
jgi:hypothetical protein